MSTDCSCPSLIDLQLYERIRDRVVRRDGAAAAHAQLLRACAERLRAAPAPSVTDKLLNPHSPSRDLHDYVSIGTYWWPNPHSADGLPYVLRDGRPSPDLDRYDRPRWDASAEAILTNIKAAYFLQDREFAEAAAATARKWFLDPRTRMNPHLRYAQMVPGLYTGRMCGIIDFSLSLPVVLDHIRLLNSLPGTPWTEHDQAEMVKWGCEFLQWLQTDPSGRQEEAAANNHAVYYDRLVIALAVFIGTNERARTQLEKTRGRITQQIEPDGGMPQELRRTCSFGYTLMNVRGFVELAWVARKLGVDLWSVSRDGRSIAAAVDFVHRHAANHGDWPYQQIEPIDWRMIAPMLLKANDLCGQRYAWDKLAHRMPAGFDPESFILIEPLHPFRAPDLWRSGKNEQR